MDILSDLLKELDDLAGQTLWTPGEPSLPMVGPYPTGEPEDGWDGEDTFYISDDAALIEHQRDADRWHGRA